MSERRTPPSPAQPPVDPAASALPTPDEVVAQVRRWLKASADVAPDRSAAQLAGLLKDPQGLAFTLGFVDRVVRPEDLRVAARNLERLSRTVPKFLPWYIRFAVVVGGGAGVILPWPVIPIARAVLRRMVGHLVVDASDRRLGKTLAHLRRDGARLNVNLLGEAVLGEQEARNRFDGTRALLARDDIDYVSVKVSSVASQLSMWGFDATVDRVVERLTPLYEQAASARTRKFINLDMEEYRDLDLTIAVFTRLLAQPALKNLEAGIVLQAYLPDALTALLRLTDWAKARMLAGGAGIKVRIVKGANLAMERVDATVHGWPLATWPTKQDTDTNYKRMLVAALTPESTDAVKIGVAGHNLFDLAFALLLARRRGVESRIDVEMLLGMATAQAAAVRKDAHGILLYTPVVHPNDFDSAISYLVRRLEENASEENFMSGLFELASDGSIFAREANRFAASLAAVGAGVPRPNRVQDRAHAALPVTPASFANEPDTDPSIAANRAWGGAILERSASSELGVAAIAAARIEDPLVLAERIRSAADLGRRWGATPAADRAAALHRIGEVLTVVRGRLIEVMASETGKTIAEADVEVSEAIDFAHHYADLALALDRVPEASFSPVEVTLVVPPWNFPVSIPAGGVLAALATGSAVLFKPAPQARRSGAVLAEAIWEAGVPRELLVLVDVDEGALGQQLITAPEIGRVLLTGSFDTAALFRSWRPELPLLAETSGKNAIVVTPSADLDLAVADLVSSAFGNAGQKCSAASLAILVGSVGSSERFRRQLVDAVTSMTVGWPQDPSTRMGPVIEQVTGKLESGLTRLGEGESWLVKPRQLDSSDRLWSPGVRDGVVAGSEFHQTEYFGPVLGIMTVGTLAEAIDVQNAVAYGLTAGIHSLETAEVAEWLATVQAGNLYVNRPITGAIVRRQPFGGWKRSSVGPGTKAGGPNTLVPLGDWIPRPGEARSDLLMEGVDERVTAFIQACQSGLDFAGFDRVRRGAESDARAWAAEFGSSRDVSALGVERNVFRYLPVEVTVRLSEGGSLDELVRVLAAGVLARAELRISSALPMPSGLLPFVGDDPIFRLRDVVVESDETWRQRMARERPGRIRMVGGDAAELARALDGAPEVAVYANPVTTAGRLELLPFLREQAVSITAHRFGNPDRAFLDLVV